MEWKRVKTILIAVLLLTCLLLAVNIVRQVRERRLHERDAVRDACAVALRAGVKIDSRLVLALPERDAVLVASRSEKTEQRLADALLGEGCVPEEPGGGVSIYENETGRISVRRGGAVEIHLKGTDTAMDEHDWIGLLQKAGLDLSNAETQMKDEETVFLQRTEEGTEIVNCRLICSISSGELLISGRWLLEQTPPQGETGRVRAELTLALTKLMEQAGATEVHALTRGYNLQSDSVRQLRLVPVWVAETNAGTIILNTVTKKIVPVS
jgi:hypothetical protein